MRIFGVSQTSGVERQLKVEKGSDGVSLTVTDSVGLRERGWIIVPGENLVAAIMDRPSSGSTIEGIRQNRGDKTTLKVEVRRNEVQLSLHPADQADIAVGLDDLQDALEGVINRA
jgi:hypothetical protein